MSRGAALAALGNKSGSPACASCHAFNGAADPSGAFPRLTGQSTAYITEALNAYAEGGRQNVLMASVSKALSPEERRDVAAYYASVYAPVPPSAAAPPGLVDRGRVITTVGVNDQQLVACATCHGPFGRSPIVTTPSLGGQFGRFIVAQLHMFGDGRRKDGSAAMAGFAHALTDEQIEAVAAYYQSLNGPVGPLPVARER